MMAGWALWCLGAFAVSMPKGMLPFALLMLVTSLMLPAVLVRKAREIARPLAVVALTMAAALALMLWSIHDGGLTLKEMENHARLLAIPYCMLWAYALDPPKASLWRGAIVGTALLCVLAVVQKYTQGVARVSGWNSNAIVFADSVAMIMVLAVLCAPQGRWRWTVLAVALATVALVLTGTRGAWPGLLLVLCIAVLGSEWGALRRRLALLALAGAVAVAGVVAVPALNHQVRLLEFKSDMGRYAEGDMDSSSGARLERLRVAWHTVLAHPWKGVGIGQFDHVAMREQVPVCRDGLAERCGFGHAHNDLAEWSATMGIPGGLALLAIYGVPLLVFLRHLRRARRPRYSAALAGAMLVVVFAICGMTQSMFAHQLTAAMYSVLVGVMLGLTLAESRRERLGAAVSAS